MPIILAGNWANIHRIISIEITLGTQGFVMADSVAMLCFLFADGAGERQLENPDHIHIFRAGSLVRLLLLLEHHGVNSGNPEVDALREMRNAVIHNGGDLSKNRNANSLKLVSDYLADLVAGNVPSMHSEPLRPFFSLNGSQVKFDVSGLSEHCRQVFMKYVPK